MKHALFASLSFIAIVTTAPAFAQESHEEHGEQQMDHSQMDHGSMIHGEMNSGTMDHSGMNHGAMQMGPAAEWKPAEGSGTARLPAAEGAMHGLHIGSGDWMVMVHGAVSAQYSDFSGPRGDDMFYSTSMLMVGGERQTDWGRIQLRSMLSLEPLMKARGYPNLFATGETADGEPLVDRQHPHDLFMELAARVDVDLSDNATIFLYGGPVGEPAIGPSAFMHRGSASNNPEPPITHHWFDSTHITYGVMTAGYSSRFFQLEGSAFRGAEPDEERWGIETPKLDSWAARATLTPSPNWALQVSHARIEQPEALHGNQDEARTTASIQYANGKGLSALAAFSAKNRIPGDTLTAWLGEVNWDIDKANSLFGRVENVNNDELIPDHDDPLHDQPFRVTKFQAGYARHFALGSALKLSLGGAVSAFAKPSALDPYYGKDPMGYTLFAKLSLGR
ncbi:MAG: hypothetical protein BGO57_05710 [Sphingomonadales bacterium 63-6]|nr:MAG: hypothetical protein BGO57_05710 [Sphingomonadales bacterium 63-6]